MPPRTLNESRTAIEITQYITSRYVPTTETFVMIGNWEFLYNQYNQPVTLEYVPYGPTVTITNTTLEFFMAASSYAEQYTVVVPYSYTATHSITESSTNLVPVSTLVGFTDSDFRTLAAVVISILVILTAWIALKSVRTSRLEQATLTQPEPSSDSKSSPQAESIAEIQVIKCSHCNAEMPRERIICPKCGLPARALQSP